MWRGFTNAFPKARWWLFSEAVETIRDQADPSALSDESHTINQTFAGIVEDVQQLSLAEKEELQELLRKYLIEERRHEIRENADTGLKEYRDGKLEVFSNVDEMMDRLSHE